jgi:hypothetical protein
MCYLRDRSDIKKQNKDASSDRVEKGGIAIRSIEDRDFQRHEILIYGKVIILQPL